VETVDANRIYNELVNKKVITRNRNNQVKNCIRITIGTPEENQKVINELSKIER
jgi:histidinol-phosphate aminotransferase